MAISYVGVGAGSAGNELSSLSPVLPAGLVDGDTLLIAVKATNGVYVPPAGWSTLPSNGSNLWVFWKTRTSAEVSGAAVTLTVSGGTSSGNGAGAIIFAYRGVTLAPTSAVSSYTGANTVTMPTVGLAHVIVGVFGDMLNGNAASSEAGSNWRGSVGSNNLCIAVDDWLPSGGHTTGPIFNYSPGWSPAAHSIGLSGNNPPNAPTLTSPANNAAIDRAIIQRFAWTFSDPDGDSQSKFDLQYRLVGAGTWTTVTQTTPNSFYDFAAAALAAGSYEWQTRTYDALGSVGPYSASSFFSAASTPATPVITAPVNGSTVNTTATLTWSAATQTNYRYRRVADLAGAADPNTIYYDSGDVVNTGTRSLTVTFTVNARWEHLQVQIKAAGLWSAWADARVNVSFTPPAVPTQVLSASSTLASLTSTITNPNPGGAVPATSYNDVYVSSPVDAELRIATLVPPNSAWTWKLPAAGRAYTVRIVAVAANGATATST